LITVIAGVNGAGKSSVIGSHFRAQSGDYFNPDEVTRALMAKDPAMTLDEANGKAWQMGFHNLKEAIANDCDYTFETTLGGNSICALLLDAAQKGIEVRILSVGLDSPEKHIQRVAARVSKGGHDIPEEKIRGRWHGSINNMMALIPVCKSVAVFDNSNGLVDGMPSTVRLFVMNDGHFVIPPVEPMPEWAKPLAAVALKKHLSSASTGIL